LVLLVFAIVYVKILSMEPEEKNLLKKVFKLSEENNHMLHTIRGIQKRQFFFSIVRWLFIIGISIGLFYFVQPFVDNFVNFTTEIKASFDKMTEILH